MLLKDESSLIEIYLSIEGGWFCISDFFFILKKLIRIEWVFVSKYIPLLQNIKIFGKFLNQSTLCSNTNVSYDTLS